MALLKTAPQPLALTAAAAPRGPTVTTSDLTGALSQQLFTGIHIVAQTKLAWARRTPMRVRITAGPAPLPGGLNGSGGPVCKFWEVLLPKESPGEVGEAGAVGLCLVLCPQPVLSGGLGTNPSIPL